jgi:hypothetical protein
MGSAKKPAAECQANLTGAYFSNFVPGSRIEPRGIDLEPELDRRRAAARTCGTLSKLLRMRYCSRRPILASYKRGPAYS